MAKERRFPRYKQQWHSICAILPAYLDDGSNGTMIYYIDGTIQAISRSLTWVLNDLLQYLCTGKPLLMQKALEVFKERSIRRLPLAAAKDFTLVPVKGRQIVAEHDRVDGYIVLEYVQRVRQENGTTVVYLIKSHHITVLDTARTLKRNLKLADALQQHNRQQHKQQQHNQREGAS